MTQSCLSITHIRVKENGDDQLDGKREIIPAADWHSLASLQMMCLLV
ncbi:hypothetical protein EMIT0196MI5_200045 [Pseudomonas sp. IT-196MI5]